MKLTEADLDADGVRLMRNMFRKGDDRKSQTIVALCDKQLELLAMLARYREAFTRHNPKWFEKKCPAKS